MLGHGGGLTAELFLLALLGTNLVNSSQAPQLEFGLLKKSISILKNLQRGKTHIITHIVFEQRSCNEIILVGFQILCGGCILL